MSQHGETPDLRTFIELAREEDELEEISGAHWDREMGAISQLVEHEHGRQSPALLFDDTPGYPEGFRNIYNQLGSVKRLALAAGLPLEYDHITDFAHAFSDALEDVDPLPPTTVSDGPLMENVRTGDDIELTELPVPKHNEQDGGRYMGTACCVITKDPESDWINLGTYRAQVRDDDEVFVYISPGKHGRLHLEKYLEREEPMPVAILFGQDPLLFIASGTETELEVNEIDYAGGVHGEPYEVIEGPETGLPLPADAEIAVEGYIRPDQFGLEGPFGEWTGYYASGRREEPYLKVDGMYFRDDPIMTHSPPHKPPGENAFLCSVIRTSLLRKELDQAGIPDVQRVWRHESGGSRLFNVVSIEQRYPGHARQAAYVAAQTRAGAYAGRWSVVVDEDIDPADIQEVLWAMSTRVDPVSDIEFIDKAWSTPLDPMIPEDEETFNSRAIVDATIPYDRLDEFPPVAEVSPEYREEIREKWGDTLGI
jgi:4-hydroxy-3-polyprenylbenzoate decarboxylase